MAKAMTKSETAANLADMMSKKGFEAVTKKMVTAFFETQADMAYKQAKNQFVIPGVGKLVLVNRKARKGRNPATGQEIMIPAKKVVKFRVSKACKDAILGAKR